MLCLDSALSCRFCYIISDRLSLLECRESYEEWTVKLLRLGFPTPCYCSSVLKLSRWECYWWFYVNVSKEQWVVAGKTWREQSIGHLHTRTSSRNLYKQPVRRKRRRSKHVSSFFNRSCTSQAGWLQPSGVILPKHGSTQFDNYNTSASNSTSNNHHNHNYDHHDHPPQPWPLPQRTIRIM